MLVKDKTPIFILGPTAAGKTQAGLDLSKSYEIEIISVDSAAIYRDMDIGTSKPNMFERQACPHHLIDILQPNESYSVGQFCRDAEILIEQIQARDKIPVLIGGTMLYFKALQNGLSQVPPTNHGLRAQLHEQLLGAGLAALYEQLKDLDPLSHAALKPNDSQRILRALEVVMTHKRSIRDYWDQAKPREIRALALMPERSVLHHRIAARLDRMFAEGFVEEVALLMEKYQLQTTHPALRCVGYYQISQYLAGQLEYEEMRQQALFASRQLAKRQITWLRSWPNVTVLDPLALNFKSNFLASVSQKTN